MRALLRLEFFKHKFLKKIENFGKTQRKFASKMNETFVSSISHFFVLPL